MVGDAHSQGTTRISLLIISHGMASLLLHLPDFTLTYLMMINHGALEFYES